jgi:hypothetical protein
VAFVRGPQQSRFLDMHPVAVTGLDACRSLEGNPGALVAAGLLSVAISPTLALVILRRRQPGVAAPDSPSPMMPVITAEDRVLTRGEHSTSAR